MSKNRTHGSIWYRLRRGLSGILCMALLLGLLPAGTILSGHAAHWADPYAQQLVDWGVMRGDVSGNLNLSSAITRAEFVTLINRAYGYDKLGPTPFTDVRSNDWYYQDIGIAYNIGYFKGTSATTASPRGTLTREQAAVLLSRNLMLQETVGETLGFSDSRSLNDWSRGLIGAAVAEGMISGYSDGSFQPRRNISRGEVAAMLVRAIGTPIKEKGDYSLGSVYGNVTINTSGVKLRNTTILGNLYLTGGIDLGDVLLENVNVLGRIVISGGGESNSSDSSVILRNVEAKEMLVDSIDGQFVTIRAEGATDIPTATVRTNAYVDDSSWPGYGLSFITLDGEEGTKLQLAGNVKEVRNMTPGSDLQVVQGSAEKITVDEYAKNSTMLVDGGARVDELNLDVATRVTGDGDIKKLNVGAAGSNVAILPEQVVIRPGITATIKGEEINSATAAEMSADPKLLAGYPSVKNIAPSTATGVFSTNKAGTVYWAISAVADGSVSVEDLIENPAYGGNIYERQSGKISASRSNNEYTANIARLLPDGSYYISAVMEDAQGRRSPLKVAAFVTPDNTVPAFNNGYPVMTKVTTETAQVTVMTNKSCQLYYALLPGGSTAPTAQEFKANSISGNLGYGVVDAVKNTTLPIKVNRGMLQEKTTYDLYLWLTDYNGANSSAVRKLSFTTPDETPPVVTSMMQSQYLANSAQVTYSLNEPGTLYWAIVTETVYDEGSFMNYDLDSLEAKVKVESGAGAIARGSSNAARADAEVRFAISGLNTATTKTTSYMLYYVAKDRDGNYSEVVGTYKIRTLDTTPPSVSQEFTSVNGDKLDEPLADTDIRLVFTETVKGSASENDPSFLELYTNVVNAVKTGDETSITNARNRLADALRAHITMMSVPRGSQPAAVTERTSDSQTGSWTVDWRYAEVGMEDGNMVVTLPNRSPEPDKDGKMSALKLESGATYFFRFDSGIFDTAINPNRMPAVDLKTFTTVYAQVSLNQLNLSQITVGTGNDAKTVRLDMSMSVTPISTDKVAASENWDMILWSNRWVGVEIYRQVDEGAWEKLNGSITPGLSGGQPYDVPVNSTEEYTGFSLYQDIMHQQGQANFPFLNNPSAGSIGGYMQQGHVYRYGIHFTHLEGMSETQYDSWSKLVTMKAAIIAGGSTDLGVVAGNVNANYDDKIQRGAVKSIGTAFNDNQMDDVLVLEKQFTDREVPKFETNGGYPKFTAGSSTIHMEINLDREGTVYYVVAPAGVIPTNALLPDGSTTPVNKNNDGTNGTASGVTYIPTDGDDRDAPANKEHIAFMGTNLGYSAPAYGRITNPNFNNSRVKTGVRRYDGSTLEIDVTGLEPSKDLTTQDGKSVYYVYFVFQGGGNKYSHVECYRVTMDVLNTPSIKVSGVGSTATLTPNAETEVTYALWEYNNLPNTIRNTNISYTGADGKAATMNMLTALITPFDSATGKTYFDQYATDTQKKAVLDYIMGSTTGADSGGANSQVGHWTIPHSGVAAGVPNHPDHVQENEDVIVDFESLMTSPKSEYVLVAMARHRYGGYEGKDYGFGAVRTLYTPDKVPPTIVTSNNLLIGANGEGFLHVSRLSAKDAAGNSVDYTKSDAPQMLFYDGEITIGFSKPLYYSRNRVLSEVWPQNPNNKTMTDEGIPIIELIDALGGNAVDGGRVEVITKNQGVVDTITLKLTGISHNETIMFFGGGGSISNGSNYPANETLTLRFDAMLKNNQYTTGNPTTDTFLPMNEPGFRVSWK